MKQEPWCLPVTLVNAKTGSIAEITYPCGNAEMIEALARCKIPYGSGAYYHKVEEAYMDGRRKDSLTKTLAGIIGSKTAPPTMHELNFLAVQIQRMPERKRTAFRKSTFQLSDSNMTDILRLAQDYSQMRMDDTGQDLSERAVLWDENDPYFQVAIRAPQTEEPKIIDCPIDDSTLAAIQNRLVIRDIDACIEQVNGVVCCDSKVSFADINRWASALKENRVGQQLGKYKAVLELEDCADVETAITLAGRLDEYEFCPDTDMSDVLGRYMLWSEDVISLNKKISDTLSQVQFLAQLQQAGGVDPDTFISSNNKLSEQLRRLKQEKAWLLDTDSDDLADRTRDLMDVLEDGPDFLDSFDAELFDALVEKIIVDSNERLRFRLKNGLELTEQIERTKR